MRKKEIKEKPSYFKLLPVGLILAIIPLIVYAKKVKFDEAFAKLWRGATEEYDFFSYYKMIWLLTLTLLSVIVFILYVSIKKIKLTVPRLFIPLGIYAVFVFLSSSFSEYHKQAFFGFPERYEGFFTILCYLIVCFICSLLVTTEFDIKYLSYFFAFSVLVLSILGITQFFGYDFLQTGLGRKLILPKESENIADILKFNFPEHYIYSTLYNPNYVGGFFALILSVCLVIFLSSEKLKLKIVSGIFCLLSFINLLGSLSATGIISMFASGIVILVFLRKILKRNILPILIMAVLFISSTFFMNYASEGKVFSDLGLTSSFSYSNFKSRLASITSPKTPNSGKISPSNILMLVNYDLKTESDSTLIDNENTTPESFVAIDQTYPTNATGVISDINIEQNTLSLTLADNNVLVVTFNPDNFQLTFNDKQNTPIDMITQKSDNKIVINSIDQRFNNINFIIENNYVNVNASNTSFNLAITQEGFKFVSAAGNITDLVKAESFGFEGKEKWGSNRGYIWSRSIPMIKDTIILGHGADTFALYFPQNDYVSKMKYLESIYTIVDKPHSLYLQMAINSGLISLIAFLVFIGWYIINSIKLYIKGVFNFYFVSGVACLASVASFLVSSLANDSTITVSIVFWVLVGVGIASNNLYLKSIDSKNNSKQNASKKA